MYVVAAMYGRLQEAKSTEASLLGSRDLGVGYLTCPTPADTVPRSEGPERKGKGKGKGVKGPITTLAPSPNGSVKGFI